MNSLDFDWFKQSLQEKKIPAGLSLGLQALWYDGMGDWDQAHTLIDKQPDRISARVHAYLHRKEGDQWNAEYWYRKADARMPNLSLADEWEMLVRQLIAAKL
jgi:hypothetical protein